MAVSLVSEVFAYMTGSDLTAYERLVLVAIAEQANKDTREAYQCSGENGKKRWNLREVVGLSETGLRGVFQRLAERGLEVRVAFGKDSSGRTLYAVYGRQTTYRLPVLSKEVGDVESSPPADVPASPRGDVQASPGDVSASPGDVQASPFPSASRQDPKSMHAREPWQIVMEKTGAKPSEARAIAARILDGRTDIRNPSGLIWKMAQGDELARHLREHRAAQKRADDAADAQVRQKQPQCEHGQLGGEFPHSITGDIRCWACRAKSNIVQLPRRAS